MLPRELFTSTTSPGLSAWLKSVVTFPFTITCRCANSDLTELRFMPPIFERRKVIRSVSFPAFNIVDFAGGIRQAIEGANAYIKDNALSLPIEIEVRNATELDQVLVVAGVTRIMLDNFSPDDLKLAVDRIDRRFETEASGGITLKTIRNFAETGVDYISVGALTHQIKSIDLSLKAF